MVDVGRQQPAEAASSSLAAAVDRRWRRSYNLYLAAFLIGPGVVAIAIMGWLKAS